MTAPRIYIARDTLAVTAFPLSDDVGYVVRLGDGDHDGVFLGSVFHEEGRWVAYAPRAVPGTPDVMDSRANLDELITDCFLVKVRLPDASEW